MNANMMVDSSALLSYESCSNLGETQQCSTVTKPKAIHWGKIHSRLFVEAFIIGTSRVTDISASSGTGGRTGDTMGFS